MKRYKKFEPLENARLAHNYLTGMVDKKIDNLPYWLLMPNKKPAEANHCKVDDAELVGSWYEGLDCAMKMLDTNEGAGVLESFRRHIMKSWGEHGLRNIRGRKQYIVLSMKWDIFLLLLTGF